MILSLLLLFSFGASADTPKSSPVSEKAPPADVLIIHDSLPGALPPGVIDGNNVLDLLGHFGLKGTVIRIEEYKPGDLNRYRFAIVMGVDERKTEYPAALIANMQSAKIPVFWIGNHLADLTADPHFTDRIGFRPGGRSIPQDFKTVQYKGGSLLKNDPHIFLIDIVDPSKATVVATAQNGGGLTVPYIVRSGDFWYCADSPFGFAEEGDRYLAFCDLLHDFFKMPHEEERQALVRLEDISVEEDPAVLRQYADYLHDRNIPFQISLVPIYVDPEDKSEIYLSDRPEFVRAIRYMVSKGGSVVMHGVTHQFRGKSTDDYEFWDEYADAPVPNDSRALVEKKLRLAMEECFKNGIYPLTWETPHYAASQLDYRILSEYFNSAYERNLGMDRVETGHYFPYTTVDRYGRFIIPENLGYIAEENPDPQTLIKNCERIKVVRDGVASFFFHPFLDIKYLQECLDGIESLGYKFISITDYDLRVQMDAHLTQTYTESIQLPMKGLYLHRFFLDEHGRRYSESYSRKPHTGVVRDPGVVPPDKVLVMEGVSEITVQTEPEQPSAWSRMWAWVQSKFEQKSPTTYTLTQPQVSILWENSLVHGDWNDQASYESVFSTYGFKVSTIRWSSYSKGSVPAGTILVVPQAVATKLSAKQNQWIVEFVNEGGCLVLDGPSHLSEMLGIKTENRSLKVHQARDLLYGSQQLTWNPPVNVVRFSTRNPIAIYAEDKASELPLVVLSQRGQGRLLYLGTSLDQLTTMGYSRFPYFVHYAMKGFGVKLPLQRGQLELYFDPGLRQAVDIERLAEQWRKLGVRAIYAAAYQFWPNWSYDYGRLLEVCHKNGILVYAWFELPHVSVKFWEDHPNWRAKTATGADGHVDWRYHMDLDIPECRDAAYAFVGDLLKRYPWDGVNIAELNLDTKGPEDPKNYLPMGATTRSAFKAQSGFDPMELFSPKSEYYWQRNPGAFKRFNDFRSQRILVWHRSLLEKVAPIAGEKDMEIIVTMLDSLHSATVTRDTGMDSRLIVSLMNEFPFTLQVEDPAHYWADSPDRYAKFANTYLKLIPDRRRLMFDINVVSNRDVRYSHSPTQLAVGSELAQTLAQATIASGRVGLYSEGTIPFEDLQSLAAVLARDARVERRWNSWVTDSKNSVLLATPGRWQDFKVDNTLWPGWGENEILVPGGKHSITAAERRFSMFDTSILDIRLLRFTGDLSGLERTDRGFRFAYDSNTRNVALFNKEPFGMLLDGQPYQDQVGTHAGMWGVRLPRGRHNVDVLADSTATVILDRASLYGSTLIVVFGAVACGLMLLIYFSVLGRRAIGRAVGGKASASSSKPSQS
ncbi:MAG TPA: DUF2334 domain-containing protein [Acidobacteriota bacterium]|nr:DUF2334 domain-containing protein [Acidobacteriota bacterium]